MNDHSRRTNVELRHFRTFIAVAQKGSFIAAAHQLHVVPSAVTETIKQLEEETGVRLLNRTTRRVSLTAEGEAFLPEALSVVSSFDESARALRALAGLERGKVSVAAAPSVVTRILAPCIASFVRAHPNVHVEVKDDGAEGIARRVADRRADFGIAGAWRDDFGLDYAFLFADRFGVICRPDDALLTLGTDLRWADLSERRLVRLAGDTGIAAILAERSDIALEWRDAAITVSNTVALEAMVLNGLGVSVLPELAAHLREPKALEFRPLRDPIVERPIHAITRVSETLSPAADMLLAMVRTAVEAGVAGAPYARIRPSSAATGG